MKIAAIYDVHGNLPALEAVMAEVRREGVDLVVVGGDVLPGPLPVETLEYITSLDTPTRFLQGNGDREVRNQMAGSESSILPPAWRDVMRWVAAQLTPDHARTLASWPATQSVEHETLGTILFCHATPRNDIEIFTRETPEANLLPVFAVTDAPVVMCGHTHMQFDRRVGTTRVVNAGSIGMPFGERGAYWALIGKDVELRRTVYDFERAAQIVRASQYPQANDFADKNILTPPREEQMLATFAAAAIK
jgi:putative phosphoesterase